jgi:WD domain, G-beta repeat
MTDGPPLLGHQAGSSGPIGGNAGAGVMSLAFFADGETLISGGYDQTIRFWDVPRRQAIGSPLIGHPNPVDHLALSGDNATLVSADLWRTIILYDVDLASWRHRACERANRNLSEEEWARYLAPEPYRATCPEFPIVSGTPVPAS